MIGFVLGSYLLTLYYIQSFFKYSPDIFMIVNSIAVVIAALGFSPLEKKLQNITDVIFYKKRNGYHETLKSLLNEIISCRSVKDLTKLNPKRATQPIIPSLLVLCQPFFGNCCTCWNGCFRRNHVMPIMAMDEQIPEQDVCCDQSLPPFFGHRIPKEKKQGFLFLCLTMK